MKLRKGFIGSSILAILISLYVILSIPSIEAVEAPQTEWSKDYTSLHGSGSWVIQTKDGGYAVAGVSYGKFLLLKTNSYGDVQWYKTYQDGVAYAVVQTSDGGYALAGNGTLFNFVKTDSNGNMQWNKTYGETVNSFLVRSLIQTSDGGYALAGWASANDSIVDWVGWVAKTDANGNMQWNKTYGNGRTMFVNAIVEANDGGYTIIGQEMISGKPIIGYTSLIKLDSNGNAQWGNSLYGVANFLVKTKDGGYLLSGYQLPEYPNGTSSLLIKTDSQGKVQWSKLYRIDESPQNPSFFGSAVQTHDGGYIVVGVVAGRFYPIRDLAAWVVKTDASGNMEWNVTYPPLTGENNTALSIIESDDGCYVFTGSLGVGRGYGDGDVWLVKIAPPSDTTSPTISILSPENKTYTVNNVSLTFTVSEPTSWIGYSLDGQANVTITGNTTLSGLSDGSHSLIVYAKDIAGNTGTSETIYFSIKTQQLEPFPLTWVVAATAIIAIGGAALLVYFRKVKKTNGEIEPKKL